MIFLDSSALLKLVYEERESVTLEEWLTAQKGAPLVSSELARVEVIRAYRQVIATAIPEARALPSELDLIPGTSDLIEQATEVSDTLLSSLDAIHLASTFSIRGYIRVRRLRPPYDRSRYCRRP